MSKQYYDSNFSDLEIFDEVQLFFSDFWKFEL